MKIALFVILVFFMFASCTKINFAEYRKDPGIDLRFCNIKTWTDIHGDEERKNLFTYNEHDNPVSVTSDHAGTGSGHHFFTYDNLQRLLKYEYEFVFTKSYHYESNSRKATHAQVTDVYGRELLETYTYDDRGRIIKSVLELVSSPFEDDEYPTQTKEYIYLNDDISSILFNGQQQNPDVEYSNKLSIYMTNKVWQFINQNYSKHSLASVETYNRMNLPLHFKANEYSFPFLDIEIPGSSVIYHCQ
ncbi:MAG TPA: hypothetical protein VM101_13385 [Flavitalea sp.]|nr:hypothetical protein [Flavitalea sp.]